MAVNSERQVVRAALVCACFIAHRSLIAQAGSAPDTTQKADPAPSLAGFKLTGFAEGSHSYSWRSLGDTTIVGRLYDRLQDRFMLNALTIVLDRPYEPTKLSAGLHAELLVGQDATMIRSNGFDLGPQADLPHLYVTLNVPTASGNGVQLKFGRIPTLLGLEVIEAVANPNWSEGNQFIYVENFTGTGVSVETKFNDHLDAQLRLINGWDQVGDNNSRKSVMGRVGLAPDAFTSLGVVGYWGPEEPNDAAAKRYGVEGLFSRKLGKTQVWLQGDYGAEQANVALPDPARPAAWSALGCWISYDLSSSVGVALRGDYVNDANGARTSGILGFPANKGQRFGSATATLNVRAWPGALVRPEVRYDRSTLPAYAGRRDQVTFALAVAYLY